MEDLQRVPGRHKDVAKLIDEERAVEESGGVALCHVVDGHREITGCHVIRLVRRQHERNLQVLARDGPIGMWPEFPKVARAKVECIRVAGCAAVVTLPWCRSWERPEF
jgi:hypothetical protein